MLNFPAPPLTVGQRYPDSPVVGLPTWQWDGEKWVASQPSGWAPLNTPIFTGTPTAPTPLAVDESNRIATTEWVRTLVLSFGEEIIEISDSMTIDASHAGKMLYVTNLTHDITLTFAPIELLHLRFRCVFLRGDGSGYKIRITCQPGETIDSRSTAPLISKFDGAVVRVAGPTNFITESARYVPRILSYLNNAVGWRPDEEIPLGCLAVDTLCVGGGGGGGGAVYVAAAPHNGYRGTGGGGGAATRKVIPIAQLPQQLNITVGLGGQGGWNGFEGGQTGAQPGGTTSFGTFLTATGGNGGRQAEGIAQGGVDGGIASGGDFNMNGGPSQVTEGSGIAINAPAGGMAGGGMGAAQFANVGNAGLQYGGGASAGNHAHHSSFAQSGAPGICVVVIP